MSLGSYRITHGKGWKPAIILLLIAFFLPAAGRALTIKVVDETGTSVTSFRWIVEKDTTYPVRLGKADNLSLSTNIGKTYSPVVANGSVGRQTGDPVQAVTNRLAAGRYFVSVLADGHTLSGVQATVGAVDNGSVTVKVLSHPVPTAQISVYVFEDNASINGAPDTPAEPGLAGFSLVVRDQAGQMSVDAWGNALGTTYRTKSDGSPVLDADGNPIIKTEGSGIILTNANGEALIKNLAPGKYGIQATPPAGDTSWVQTATIEGTPGIDTWVAANEPPYFAEFGMQSWHAFIGFVHPMKFRTASNQATVGRVTGAVVVAHEARPPASALASLESGTPAKEAWVGLSDLDAADQQVYAAPCAANGTFSITDVPPGTYLLSIWDKPLDLIIDFRTITVAANQTTAMGPIPVFAWFGNYEGSVFNDKNKNGYRDPGELGIANQALNIRFPDGSIYQSTLSDTMGEFAFNEVFPFFHWLITEVDYTRMKPTGTTFIVDNGGILAPGMKNVPQPQPENGGRGWRTEVGPTLLEGMIVYGGQTNEAHWGKAEYVGHENGGIVGIVYYDTTRAENNPALCVGEPWQPGIPRVQVALFADFDNNGKIDDLDGDTTVTIPDVDNWPLGWAEGTAPKGPEDVDRVYPGHLAGVFDPGDAINIVYTDSWDDNPPTGLVNGPGGPQLVHGKPIPKSNETLQTWNQMRPGVFDGGYWFNSYFVGLDDLGTTIGLGMAAHGAATTVEVNGLPGPRTYIVQSFPPKGHQIVKEEDKNVDFGDPYVPSTQEQPIRVGARLPTPVGDLHSVPRFLSLYPGVEVAGWKPGMQTPLADRKLATVRDGQNTNVDFFMFTEVPKSARIWGVCLNDALLEFDPTSPNWRNNFGVPWLPIAIKDYQGNEIARTYTDEWGRYNALAPSTYSINVPCPTGVSPGMYIVSLNDPGPIPDPKNPGKFITDPYYNPGYMQNSSPFDFWPGKTTNLDTPILPIAAFQSGRQLLDCDFTSGTPVIREVNGPTGGPYVKTTPSRITFTSIGIDPKRGRDYSFGKTPGLLELNRIPLTNVHWTSQSITATVPSGSKTGQIQLIRGDNGVPAPVGITINVGGSATYVSPRQSIQAAIDAAHPGDLILVKPGVHRENVIMYRKIRLQGYGAFASTIQAGPQTPGEKTAWDNKLQSLIAAGLIDVIPGERSDFFLERGAGIMVATKQGAFTSTNPARIDGIGVQGAIQGGGIFVNAYAHYLQISNNHLESNQGNFGGGVRIGTPSVSNTANTGYNSSFNDHLFLHHNDICQNGAIDGGGGVAIFNGTDNYVLSENVICGNYSFSYGGGIAHFGLSKNGAIYHNVIQNNQAADEAGGIMIAGELVSATAPAGTLTQGSGSVTIDGNRIQGNLGGDDGGGIRTLMANGQDVKAAPSDPAKWHAIRVFNNLIINNVSADSGGGIALDDTVRAFIINNTVARNDSTATSPDSFAAGPVPPEVELGGGLTNSVPQIAGISSAVHSDGLQAAFGARFRQTYPNPAMFNNIIRQNRSFWWDANLVRNVNGTSQTVGGLRPLSDLAGGSPFWDLGVQGTPTPQYLNPQNCLLTSRLGYSATNRTGNPLFRKAYFNTFEATAKGAALGNFVTVTFTPLGYVGDYHISPGSPATAIGSAAYMTQFGELGRDIDWETRPRNSIDAGADEIRRVSTAAPGAGDFDSAKP